MRKVLLSVLCLFAAVAVNAAKEVDIPLDGNWERGWNASTEYADGILTITNVGNYGAAGYRFDEPADWSKYDCLWVVIESHTAGWGQVLIRNGQDQDIYSAGTGTINQTTTIRIPFDPTKATSIGGIFIQGALTDDTYKISRVYLTKATFYEETPTASLEVSNTNPQFFPASLFEGFSDDARVVFTVDIQGSADYNGWGIGELTTADYLATAESNWQPVNGIKIWTVGGGKDGLTQFVATIAELTPALTSWPDTNHKWGDADENYGIVSNMYGQGNGKCTVTLQSVEIFEVAAPVDAVVDVEDGEEIASAVSLATLGTRIGKLTINLPEQGTVTLKKTLEAADNVIINGNYATINIAEGMKDPFITLDETEVFAKKNDGTDSDHKLIGKVEFNDVTIAGLKNSLVKDNQKTLLEELAINNSNIEMPAASKNVIDFNGKGYVGKVSVEASTIWAAGKNEGFFAQYGSRPKNVNGDWLQEFSFKTSTIVNIANGKNFCNLKQQGTAQNVYTMEDCIFVDCGKQNQLVVGLNGGQTSPTPVWDVSGNYFAWGGECVNAAEIEKAGQKNDEDIVKDCIDGKLTFDDAANGDFNGTFELGADVEEPDFLGDDDWTIEFTVTETGISTVKADTNNDVIYNLNGQQVVKAQKGLYIINGKKAIVK